MSVINTNITSMIAQQNLNSSENSLSTSIERLSSGLKINSASDDAAGQAIANRMTSQITGLSQASSNASDGISLAQTTEGALDQVNDNLQRIRELSVQASNGTNSQSDLQSIQDEITQRLDEIDRISSQTAFNGVDVLSKDQTITIQVGANDGETIDIKLSEINAKTLGLDSFNVNGYDTTLTASTLSDSSGAAITSANTSYVDKSGTTVTTGTLSADADGDYFLTVGGKTYAAEVTLTTSGTTTSASISIDTENEVTKKSTSTLTTLDNALNTVDSMRSDLGAVQNRFDSAITNISTTTTNLTSARSGIQDVDYATEVSAMTSAQILQQAGTSVLAQANSMPEQMLSLLQ
ncbi:FliC/FljB family flagellin [Pseudomonas veronii]|jgi:flagellin|uniref:FliC/FljB family flagellin n=1 Tax=Pseudomonas veronii TaxID=76761 RepID=UPI002D77A0E0|nr:FliC/FljB family flagellin [Pseudomonas veronii]MCI1737490.1 FliC/FljB family flagellin [Pseudomonas veronii]WRU61742.1 FliC/FljB family flagellin [Pseudomonas veronii]